MQTNISKLPPHQKKQTQNHRPNNSQKPNQKETKRTRKLQNLQKQKQIPPHPPQTHIPNETVLGHQLSIFPQARRGIEQLQPVVVQGRADDLLVVAELRGAVDQGGARVGDRLHANLLERLKGRRRKEIINTFFGILSKLKDIYFFLV